VTYSKLHCDRKRGQVRRASDYNSSQPGGLRDVCFSRLESGHSRDSHGENYDHGHYPKNNPVEAHLLGTIITLFNFVF
jgi:hypothetical protein